MPGVVTYPFYRQAPDAGAAIRDVEAVIEYNGLVLNDLLTPDHFYITEIDGIDEAEIRDARDTRPDDHGEVAYRNYFNGKTITLSGTIKSGNMQMLEQMKQELRAAFSTLTEMPMKLRWFDVFDGFDDPNALAYYSSLETSLDVQGGRLVSGLSGSSTYLRTAEHRAYRDVRQTLKISADMAGTRSSAGIVLKYIDDNTILSAVLGSDAVSVMYGALETGSQTILSIPIVVDPFAFAWIRSTSIGNIVTVEVFDDDPVSTASDPIVSGRIDLRTIPSRDSVADVIGADVDGLVGIRVVSDSTVITVDDYRIESIYPGDVVINCRCIDKQPVIRKTQTNSVGYYRDFQLSMRASNPRFINQVIVEAVTQPYISNTTVGRVYPRSYPLAYATHTSATGQPVSSVAPKFATVYNRGTFDGSPTITVFGAMVNPVITNLTTGEVIYLNTSISAGDWIEISTDSNGNRQIVDSTGASMFAAYDPASAWISVIASDANDFVVSADQFDSNASIRVGSQHTFM